MSFKLLTEYNLEFLHLKVGCTGSSESTVVHMPHCWKSHVAAHINISPTPSKEYVIKNHFAYFSTKTCVVCTQNNRLIETILLSIKTKFNLTDKKMLHNVRPIFFSSRGQNLCHLLHLIICLFDLILYVPVNIFQLCRDGSSCVKQVLSKDKCTLLKDTTQ